MKLAAHVQSHRAGTNDRIGIEVYRDIILGTIEAQVDITLVKLADMLRRDQGACFAPSTVWRFLDRHAMTVKKRRTPASRSGPTLLGGG